MDSNLNLKEEQLIKEASHQTQLLKDYLSQYNLIDSYLVKYPKSHNLKKSAKLKTQILSSSSDQQVFKLIKELIHHSFSLVEKE